MRGSLRPLNPSAAPALAASPAAAPSVVEATTTPPDRPRILICDDQPDVRQALRLLLKCEGYATEMVESPAQAIEAVRARKFAAVLFDLNYTRDTTSGREGLEALPHLLALDRDLPVVVMTAWGSIDLAVDAMRRGARDFISKPWDNDKLLKLIETQVRFRDVLRQPAPVPIAPEPSVSQTAMRREAAASALREELEGAANYIRALLPAPQERPFRIDWRFVPFSAVGGDAFGYHWLDADHLAIYLLDVCGHGVPAALLSATALKVLAAGALPAVDFRDPGMVLTAMNDRFLMRDQANLYFTVWYGVWQPGVRRMRYACAGHPPAVITAAGKTVLLGARGLVLGARAGKVYATHAIEDVPTNAQLFVYSDGIYELLKPDGKMWQHEEFVERLLELDRSDPAALDHLLDTVRHVRGGEPPDDDLSIVRFAL